MTDTASVGAADIADTAGDTTAGSVADAAVMAGTVGGEVADKHIRSV
jgi:hypothetical protein